MAKLKWGWQVLAVSLAMFWAGYLAFDLMPPVLDEKGRIYLINALFLREAVPRCLASEDWLGCLGLLVARLNAVEVYLRTIIVLFSGSIVWWLHIHIEARYSNMLAELSD